VREHTRPVEPRQVALWAKAGPETRPGYCRASGAKPIPSALPRSLAQHRAAKAKLDEADGDEP
jgi:hypothetical protein